LHLNDYGLLVHLSFAPNINKAQGKSMKVLTSKLQRVGNGKQNLPILAPNDKTSSTVHPEALCQKN
jgi:hypothetical protein